MARSANDPTQFPAASRVSVFPVSVPSARRCTVTEEAVGPTHFFSTGTVTFSVLVLVTVKPVAASPVVSEL